MTIPESVISLARRAAGLGDVARLIHAAGVSPSQAPPQTILRVDLYGTALVLEEFGRVIASGGSGVVVASQSGHVLPALTAEQERQLATTPVEELMSLPMLQPDTVLDPLYAYQLAKRGNALRVRAEAVRWAQRGARINAISPGVIVTPMSRDELRAPGGAAFRAMIETSPAGRAGTPDEVATVGALLLGPDGAFITGSDVLMDGGLTAAYFYGSDASASLRGSGSGCRRRHGEDSTMSDEQVAQETRGVTVELLATVDLGPEIPGMAGRQLRMRRVTMEPGGVFGPVHDHQGRPGTVYVLQGTITDHRDGVTTEYGPGLGWPEDRNTLHWLENRGDVPAVEISVDVVRSE